MSDAESGKGKTMVNGNDKARRFVRVIPTV